MEALQYPTADTAQSSLTLVWNGEREATAVTAQGQPIRLGPEVNLSGHDLFAMAASMCLMATVLGLARERGLAIEGYVSSARVGHASGRLTIALAPCVVVRSAADCGQIDSLWREAIERSAVLRLLGSDLQIEPSVRAIAER